MYYVDSENTISIGSLWTQGGNVAYFQCDLFLRVTLSGARRADVREG
jgi:hypothetical protein